MIEITGTPLSPDSVVKKVKSDGSGCVVTYVGLIRNQSQGRPVLSVEYQDPDGSATGILQELANETRKRWPIENVAISHRIGKLKVGDINLVVAVASAHRVEGFAACQYIIDQFKERLPTRKIELYQDG
jgi:molybdopterin synthase catalytic subunit